MDLEGVQRALRSIPRIEDAPPNASADVVDLLGAAAEFSKLLAEQRHEVREIVSSLRDPDQSARIHEALQREQERAASSEQQLRRMADVLIATLDLLERMLAALSADPNMKTWETQTRQALDLTLHNAAKVGFVALGTTGEAYDKSIHDLASEMPGGSTSEPRVASVRSRGYALNGKILRRASVDCAE